MTQIQLPNHAVPVSFETAMDRYDQGKKVLAILSDENGIYAAHAYSRDWTNLDRRTKEFREYAKQGQWFLLSQ